jgi:hypothetical protein
MPFDDLFGSPARRLAVRQPGRRVLRRLTRGLMLNSNRGGWHPSADTGRTNYSLTRLLHHRRKLDGDSQGGAEDLVGIQPIGRVQRTHR